MSITAKVKYLKSVLRFLAVITVTTASVLGYTMEDESPISFKQVLRYYPILPQLLDPFSPIEHMTKKQSHSTYYGVPLKIQEKTLSLKSSHQLWNGYFLDATKKLKKRIKKGFGTGLIDGTLIIYHRFGENDLQIPAIMTLKWYREQALVINAHHEFQQSFIKKIKQKTQYTGGTGKDWTLYKGSMGKIPLELSINGNITFNGNLRFHENDLVTTNQRDNKNWDLEIEQTQRFNIKGNIGDRFFIDIEQDSEADFSWENDLNIEYRGKKDEILQKAEAGNINLNLVGMDAVTMGGNNSSLFGIKTVMQLGPVEIQSVVAMEEVKKSEQTMTGGMVSGDPISINDYNFIYDRYFFIDDSFKTNYYPLDATYSHSYNPERVVGNYEVYQFGTGAVETIYATAYVDPSEDTSYSVPGNWKRLDEYMDYKIDPLLGYIRVNSTSQSAIAIAYTTTSYNDNEFGADPASTDTNFKQEYFDCIDSTGNSTECEDAIKLKLIKDNINKSTPLSPTWSLMFKNVYPLGGSNIERNSLEVDIVRDIGADLQETHSDSGNSYLSIFGIDSENQSQEKVEGGDGKIDLYDNIIMWEYGELILPAHLPFAYDESGEFGNNHPDLSDILPELNEVENSPAMYYDNTTTNKINQHEFLITVKTSSQNTSMNLGFMIVEGSETVRLGAQVLQKDVDYTIDYFSGNINFISEDAMAVGAEITVSYEENLFINFDQKSLIGTYMKYAFGENNYLAGGMFYYNQAIAEQKVDIGYEPMSNFAWNITGKYSNELEFLTRAVDFLPLIQTTKPSQFSIEGNFAEIIPNPNPLGQAFIDDFESAKRTSSLSIMQKQWKMASPPDPSSTNSSQTIQTRGKMIWYNPFTDEYTKNIWPEQSTSSQNNKTIVLEIKTEFDGAQDATLWNGIMTPLYNSEYIQSESKYMDIWINADSVEAVAELKLHIDIGHISEDLNSNEIFDTEDKKIYNSSGDGYLDDSEDIGVDQCTNLYEDGWGGCLCNEYSDDIYTYLDLIEIYEHEEDLCIDDGAVTYDQALESEKNIYADPDDPNGDDWCYNHISFTADCGGQDDYSRINGTEGNGKAIGYRYPDTEDMNKNETLDTRNDYFTISINPLDHEGPNSLVVTETVNNNILTGWKLFRIPLISFNTSGAPNWGDVRTFRLRLESAVVNKPQLVKIAKIELVRNEWKELGIAHIDSVIHEISIYNNPYFSVEVINTDESTNYNYSLDKIDIVREHDAIQKISMKEQSLVLSFIENQEHSDSSGLVAYHAGLINNSFLPLSSDKSLSYFAYKNMEMFIYGGDPEYNEGETPTDSELIQNCDWYSSVGDDCESGSIDFLFRFGKENDDDFYEIRQPIYKGWDERNHLNINIDKLTQVKLPILNAQIEGISDIGEDGVASEYENGCVEDPETPLGGSLLPYTYNSILDSLVANGTLDSLQAVDIDFNKETFGDTLEICGQDWWIAKECSTCELLDPNGDNYDFNDNPDGTEGNYFLDGDEEFTDLDGDETWYDGGENYQEYDDLYVWKSDIEEVCSHCTELRIKGEPSINNIQNIIMGVVNNSSDQIYGKILVNELRMTGVKKSKEQSYSISGSLNFADLMTISANFKHKDSGFHKLQQRLGTGNSDDTYSATVKLHPNLILPTRWGIKTPITFTYSNSIYTPKYYPGSDVITATTDADFNIKDIQTRNEKLSISTSFNKSSRSTNWLIKRTIDNISLNMSAIKNNYSSSQIQKETKVNYQLFGSYTYSWGKENYFSPFKFTKDWLIIGTILSQSRYYYTPDKFTTSIQFNENDKYTTQRSNIFNTINQYSFTMQRKFTLNHKFTKMLSSTYTRKIDSKLDKFRYDKWKIIKTMDPGLVEDVSEKFTNTYKPDFMQWLNPTFTFNPTYTWHLNILDTVKTADVTSSATFKTQIGLNIQDMIELIYTPENKNKSSRGRGRSRSSSSTNNNKIDIKNPSVRFILGKIHSLASKLRSISSTYTYSASHNYDNIESDASPSYFYRLGLQRSPGVQYYVADSDNSIIGSFMHSYSTDIVTRTNLDLITSVNTSLEFEYGKSLSNSSIGSTTENKSVSYFPRGPRGNQKGFPMVRWDVTWSKIEKWWILDRVFQSVTLKHGFNGEQSMTFSNSIKQNEQYTLHYAPVLGMTGTTKGPDPFTIVANYYLNRTINNPDEHSTVRNHNDQMTMTIKKEKTGGFLINTFFFRDFYIKNNIEFLFTFNYTKDRTLGTSTRVSNITDFNEDSKNMSWSIKPELKFSFTDLITGNFYIIYGITESKTTGRKEERDFGFTINIRIHG